MAKSSVAARRGTAGTAAMRETVSDVLLETLHAEGIEYIFANLGTDYPPIVESLAKHGAQGAPLPEVLLCPHENTAITAAHGYALATGKGQGVFVHVGVGTQNLGGALQNAWAGRVPMLIFAGRTPVGTRGERLGSRDSPIHYFQDVRDQAGIIRQYCKWEFNLEAPEQSAYALQRAVRLMQSDPQGAVYVTAAREVLAMPVGEMVSDPPRPASQPRIGELAPPAVADIAAALHRAERPLVITSYLGRKPEAVPELAALSEALTLPVVEMAASYLNFPRDHAHHCGYRSVEGIAEADVILLLDTDVPWLAKFGMPRPTAHIIQLDVDPLKPHIQMWDFPVTESHWGEAAQALPRIVEQARALPPLTPDLQAGREAWLASLRPGPVAAPSGNALTVAALSAVVGEALPKETVIVDEGVTSADVIRRHTCRTIPGTYFGLPGGSLGWGGGVALGHKLAKPEQEVVWLVGDGSYLFAVPSSLFLTAQRYGTPFLSVIYNNGGWNAVKAATDRVYGAEGQAAVHRAYAHDLGDALPLEKVAEACGCWTARAETPEQARAAIADGLKAVAGGRSAVVNAILKEG